MSQPIIFMGGAHGVGKTTISRLLADVLALTHVTAGTLIQEYDLRGTSTVEITRSLGKAVPNVHHNQEVLLQSLEARRRQDSTTPLLLDGHFTLLNPVGGVVTIPLEVFAAIRPIAVLLVEAKHSTVHCRLQKRDGTAPSLATIKRLALTEREHATKVSASLKAPMWTVSGDELAQRAVNTAMRFLRPLLNRTA